MILLKDKENWKLLGKYTSQIMNLRMLVNHNRIIPTTYQLTITPNSFSGLPKQLYETLDNLWNDIQRPHNFQVDPTKGQINMISQMIAPKSGKLKKTATLIMDEVPIKMNDILFVIETMDSRIQKLERNDQLILERINEQTMNNKKQLNSLKRHTQQENKKFKSLIGEEIEANVRSIQRLREGQADDQKHHQRDFDKIYSEIDRIKKQNSIQYSNISLVRQKFEKVSNDELQKRLDKLDGEITIFKHDYKDHKNILDREHIISRQRFNDLFLILRQIEEDQERKITEVPKEKVNKKEQGTAGQYNYFLFDIDEKKSKQYQQKDNKITKQSGGVKDIIFGKHLLPYKTNNRCTMKVHSYHEGELAIGIVDNCYRDLQIGEIENLPNYLFYSLQLGEVIESALKFPKYKQKWKPGDQLQMEIKFKEKRMLWYKNKKIVAQHISDILWDSSTNWVLCLVIENKGTQVEIIQK